MIAVIFGLVAVVLLVLMVVAIGMRSMNRRESNLPPERLKKMAEQAEDPNAKRPGRPAEETFFESFPEGFDAFQEPERATARLRPGNGKPASRPAAGRPGGRSAPRGKASHSARGRRGVDEWGDADDYDDDYWTRVRADDGAFGGTIAARMGTSRPDLPTGSADARPPAAKPAPKEKKEPVDAEATTVQAPLPTRPASRGDQSSRPGRAEPAPSRAGLTDQPPAASRPSPGLADLVERPAAAASERTVTFPAPVAQTPAASDVLGALGTPQPAAQPTGRTRRPSRPDPADPLGLSDGRAKPRRRGEGDSGRGASRSGESRRSDGRRAPGGTTPPRGVTAARAADAGHPGRTAPARGQADPPAAGTQPEDPLSSGSFPTGAVHRGPSPKNPLATGPVGGDPLDVTRVTGPFESRPAANAYERVTGPFAASGQTGSYGRDPLSGPAPVSADPVTGRTGDLPSRQSWPAQPAYPATGLYDILDGPEPAASGSNETWRAADYQMPSPEGGSYPARETYPGETSYPASASSYEVRPGWATIDDGDATISAPTPSLGQPSSAPPRRGPAYEEPRPDQGYGQQAGDTAPGTSSGSWPRPPQNTGGSWPSYSELYGNGGPAAEEPSRATRSRGGHHRVGDPEYPDYYR
ncbi:hypothetical protein ABGB17_36805 [Sphaerisporangium sp. B11E5]|uniref:hypothetical protein n=1 Tax=Sphaerisporangium sp. B11E5 TaxID=3153563 RepID=UPI00325D7CA4